MSKTEFIGALCWEPSRRGVPRIYIDVAEFVDNVWSWAEEDNDAGRWADAFGEAHEGAEARG
jgi:hypothetical protein